MSAAAIIMMLNNNRRNGGHFSGDSGTPSCFESFIVLILAIIASIVIFVLLLGGIRNHELVNENAKAVYIAEIKAIDPSFTEIEIKSVSIKKDYVEIEVGVKYEDQILRTGIVTCYSDISSVGQEITEDNTYCDMFLYVEVSPKK